jgi:hypothetical protein
VDVAGQGSRTRRDFGEDGAGQGSKKRRGFGVQEQCSGAEIGVDRVRRGDGGFVVFLIERFIMNWVPIKLWRFAHTWAVAWEPYHKQGM